MKKKLFISLTIIICLIIGAGVFAYIKLNSNCVEVAGSVNVPEGTMTKHLMENMLDSEQVRIKSVSRLKSTAKMLAMGEQVRSGHYVVRKGMSYKQVVRMFQRGFQTPIKLVYNNIRGLPQLAGRVGEQIEPDSLSLIQYFSSDTIALHYGFTPQTFIAMFIPNTYEVYWNISPLGFMDRMKKEFDIFWNPEREAKLQAIQLTRTQAITLASIVYEETKMSDEMPIVAGVYINRLDKGMKLQADPTVKYAVGDFTLKRILYKHLDVDSPYNTYMYAGLPPGPICMPSVKAIDAVLNPQKHNYLFFCAKPDFSGYHNFAITNAEHNRNRDAWIKAIDQAAIR